MAAVIERMRAAGSEIAVHPRTTRQEHCRACWSTPTWWCSAGCATATLVELAAVEAAGVRCCNPIGACVAVADRVGVGRALAGAGVAVPAGAHRRGVE